MASSPQPQPQQPQQPPPQQSVMPRTITFPKNAGVSVDGLAFCRNQNGRLMVAAVSSNSELYRIYGLDNGMEVLSINNADTTTLSETGADIILQSASLVTFLIAPPVALKRGQFVTAVIRKEIQDTTVGVALQQANPLVDTGMVTIREILPKSLVARFTTLQPGMQLVSVNNVLCMNSKETAAQLRHAMGTLTLLAYIPGGVHATPHPITATLSVADMYHWNHDLANNTNRNLGVQFVTRRGKVMISQVDPRGPFSQTDLHHGLVGMELVSINNLECDSVAMANTLLAKSHVARGVVTLVAQQTCHFPPGTFVAATVLKDHIHSKLGIMVGMDHVGGQGTQVVVKFVSPGGLVSRLKCPTTGMPLLQPGMFIHKVNNTAIVAGKHHNKDVSHLFQTAERTVTILAQAPTSKGTNPTPPMIVHSLCTVVMTKKLNDQNIGLKVTQEPSGRWMVSHVDEKGLAAACGMRVGMCLWKINHRHLLEDSAITSPEHVMALIQQTPAGVPVTLLIQAPMIQPVVTGTIWKETKDSLVGIRLRKHKEDVAIINITQGSVSSETDLLGGMLIKSINNEDCSGNRNPEEVANMLASAVGRITILAMTPDCILPSNNFVTAAVAVPKQPDANNTDNNNDSNDPTNVFSYEEGKVWISEQGAKGLFQGSALRVGMQVVSLNSIDCSLLTQAAIRTLLVSSDCVTILARKPVLPAGVIVTEVFQKPTADTRLGLTFRSINGKILITAISDGSLSAASKLLAGMELFMINNSNCRVLSAEGVAEILGKATGTLTIVAGTSAPNLPTARRLLVTATLQEPTTNGDNGDKRPLGITVSRMHDKIIITKIAENSLASESDLAKGMEILSINNVSCKQKKALDVASILSTTKGTVTILAERPPVPQGDYVTGAFMKESARTKVGVTMRYQNGKVLIKQMVEDSLFESTDLQVGMWIKTINNMDVTHFTVQQVAKTLGAQSDVVTVLAETTSETFEELVPDPTEDPKGNDENGKDSEEEEGKDESVSGDGTGDNDVNKNNDNAEEEEEEEGDNNDGKDDGEANGIGENPEQAEPKDAADADESASNDSISGENVNGEADGDCKEQNDPADYC